MLRRPRGTPMTRTNLTRCRLTAACLTPGVVLAWASLGATVGVAQPDVRVVGLRWEETVAVQRNGEIEPGEVGRVVVTLENRGDVAATGVLGSIAIVPPIPGVSMISGATTWADLAPGARAEDQGRRARMPSMPSPSQDHRDGDDAVRGEGDPRVPRPTCATATIGSSEATRAGGVGLRRVRCEGWRNDAQP